MNRRSFLRGLLALPLAPLAAKLLPKGEHVVLPPVATPRHVGVDYAASGSDQTSIWFIDWQDNHRRFMAEHHRIISDYIRTSGQLAHNWLKESIRGN